MTKMYLVANIDYEDFDPIELYHDKEKALQRIKEKNNELESIRLEQDLLIHNKIQELERRYPDRWVSSTELYDLYEVEVCD